MKQSEYLERMKGLFFRTVRNALLVAMDSERP